MVLLIFYHTPKSLLRAILLLKNNAAAIKDVLESIA